LMIWTISLFALPLTLMLFKFSRLCNLPDPYQSPKFRPMIRSSPVLLQSIHLTQLHQANSLAPTTTSTLPRIKFVVPGLDHDAVETFGPYPVEILLNGQVISRILEDQQMLRLNCLGDFFPQITISEPSVPVATLLPRVL
jgi:hypothetical protein